MFPKQQQQDEEDTIELLSSTEKLQVPKQRHVRTGSASSFIHFKAPVQKEPVDSQVTHPNRLASQVNQKRIDNHTVSNNLPIGFTFAHYLCHWIGLCWLDDGYLSSKKDMLPTPLA